MEAKATLRAGEPPTTLEASTRPRLLLSPHEIDQLERRVEHHEKRIDQAVFALYGVDSLPSP